MLQVLFPAAGIDDQVHLVIRHLHVAVQSEAAACGQDKAISPMYRTRTLLRRFFEKAYNKALDTYLDGRPPMVNI